MDQYISFIGTGNKNEDKIIYDCIRLKDLRPDIFCRELIIGTNYRGILKFFEESDYSTFPVYIGFTEPFYKFSEICLSICKDIYKDPAISYEIVTLKDVDPKECPNLLVLPKEYIKIHKDLSLLKFNKPVNRIDLSLILICVKEGMKYIGTNEKRYYLARKYSTIFPDLYYSDEDFVKKFCNVTYVNGPRSFMANLQPTYLNVVNKIYREHKDEVSIEEEE